MILSKNQVRKIAALNDSRKVYYWILMLYKNDKFYTLKFNYIILSYNKI